MFDATQNGTAFGKEIPPDTSEKLKQRCLNPASLWVMKRRANRPYVLPQRLPVVARVS